MWKLDSWFPPLVPHILEGMSGCGCSAFRELEDGDGLTIGLPPPGPVCLYPSASTYIFVVIHKATVRFWMFAIRLDVLSRTGWQHQAATTVFHGNDDLACATEVNFEVTGLHTVT